ncbi:MAG TPA: hypothetical protein VF618_01610 [Thermoanaerobaculia bacterium]
MAARRPAHRLAEAIDGLGEAFHGLEVAIHGDAEAIHDSTDAIHGSAEAITGIALAIHGSADPIEAPRSATEVSEGTPLAALPSAMAQDFEGLLKDIFGDSFAKVTSFQQEQLGKLTSRLQDVARDAVKDELTKLHTEVADLRSRLARLEEERAQAAADSLETSF